MVRGMGVDTAGVSAGVEVFDCYACPGEVVVLSFERGTDFGDVELGDG